MQGDNLLVPTLDMVLMDFSRHCLQYLILAFYIIINSNLTKEGPERSLLLQVVRCSLLSILTNRKLLVLLSSEKAEHPFFFVIGPE